MLETCGRLDSAGAAGAGSAGDAGAASAIGGFAQAWSAALRDLAGAVAATATNLDAAANAYAGTDEQAIPAGKR
jgi:hypothetical protein